jgi:C1A family cysteine protease
LLTHCQALKTLAANLDIQMSKVMLQEGGDMFKRIASQTTRILTIWALSGAFIQVAGADEPQPQQAPVSPGFQQYLDSSLSAKSAARQLSAIISATGEPVSTGYIPSPNDYSHLTGKASQIERQQDAIERAFAPLQYDLRTEGRVTPVRNQGACGACWAFGSIASVESVLLPGETRDFSENNLKNTSGFDWSNCEGGNADMATAYFSRWAGPIAETDDPYSASSAISPSGLLPKKHIQEVLIIPGRASALDNDGIKQALINYGAITTSIYVDGGASSDSTSSYFKPVNGAYYYYGAADSNHMVAIVGWDDTYSAANFSTKPAGNGAFIAKNSWGTSWGNNGYFYISYYDSLVGQENYLFKSATDPALYASIYQYDPLGKTGSYGFSQTKAWFANIFSAFQSETLAAVAFHTNDINAAYEAFIYKGVTVGNPRSGTLAATFSGTIPYPGYHTLPVPVVVPLLKNERFSVVVNVTNPNDTHPIPIDQRITGYTSKATASAGHGYISSTGTTWQDITQLSLNTNISLKAFSTTTLVNGACGSSDGGVFATAPAASLCAFGTASSVTGSGPWNWSCAGANGGTTAACGASILTWTTTATVTGGNGTVSCTSPTNNGATTTCTVIPATGYKLATFTDNGVDKISAATGGNYSIVNVTADHAIAATFGKLIPISGVCGSSNTLILISAPTTNLCTAGTASSVTGSGPWNWSCSGSEGGTTVSCGASIRTWATTATVTGGNGTVSCTSPTNNGATTTYTVIPATGYKLATFTDNGVDKISAVAGGTYSIVNVTADHAIAATFGKLIPISGVCGSSNTLILISAPATNLCTAGTASSVTGSGPWNWSCSGSEGGTTVSCGASILTWTTTATVTGGNGTVSCTSPTNNGATATCTVTPASGYKLATFTDNGVDKISAATGGNYSIVNVTADHAIAATFGKLIPISGVCGSSNTLMLISAPATNLCTAGTASSVTGSGPWNWSCSGSEGGATTLCSADIRSYSVTFTSGGNGTLTGTASQTVNYKSSATPVTAVPATGFKFVSWSGTCGFANTTANPLIITNVTADCANSASFSPIVTPDVTAPVVTMLLPTTSTSLTVPVATFSATDNIAVTGYLLNETATKPAASATGWTATAPASYTFATAGAKTLYAWAKDAAGNISNTASAAVTVTLPGDISGDSVVDVADALLVLQYALNLIPHTAANNALYLAVADVAPLDTATMKPRGDGKIDVMDALVILQRAAGMLNW